MTAGVTTIDELALADWRREVFALYARVRESDDPRAAWDMWRRTRDRLFAEHPQSPLDADGRAGVRRAALPPLRPGRPGDRRRRADRGRRARDRDEHGNAVPVPPLRLARFSLARTDLELPLYWLDGYGGGLFLPFADGTSGRTTYGAGRYLLDTVKGADLGTADGRLVLDFNFAYNPSCVYDPAWTCPLAPAANRLPVDVRAGERVYG